MHVKIIFKNDRQIALNSSTCLQFDSSQLITSMYHNVIILINYYSAFQVKELFTMYKPRPNCICLSMHVKSKREGM